jgi:hypothetical protein
MREILFILVFAPVFLLATVFSSSVPSALACCVDEDEDGYGVENMEWCDYPEPDCDDDPTDDPLACTDCTCGEAECAPCARCINPGAAEGPCCGPTCFDEIDNDCDGLTDKFDDPDCSIPCGCPPSAEASVYGPGAVMKSGALAQVGLFLVPVAQILLLRRLLRRKR